MNVNPTSQSPRRGFLKSLALGGGLGWAALAAGCRNSAEGEPSRGLPRLRVAFSNGGLQTTWCKLGYDTAMLWATLLELDLHWFDGELNPQEQRNKVELLAGDTWDLCCFQACQSDILAEPVRQLKRKGVPVISVDTLLVDKERLRDVGVWVQIAANHRQLAESSTRYLMEKIGGKGKVIHIGGASAHSGARDRAQGFSSVVAGYPGVEVIGGGVRWCDWRPEKARDTFDSLISQTREPIAGAFFHNDDMALACIPGLAGTIHQKMVITAVDGQKEGLSGVRDGRLAATTVNPTCMLHAWALIVGQFIVRNGEKIDNVPLEIPCPSPLVSKESGNLEAMFWLSDPAHCMV
jgi:ribose transport system substrate-binding protein